MKLFTLLFKQFQKKIKISEIQEVEFGLPKRNLRTTVGAINIRSLDKEITFAPNLFDKKILKKLFQDLQHRSPTIKFDNYASSIINQDFQVSEAIAKVEVLKNTFFTVLLMLSLPAAPILFYYAGGRFFLSRETTAIIAGTLLFLTPFIFSKIMNKIKRKEDNQQSLVG